jgi:hypothetical protein
VHGAKVKIVEHVYTKPVQIEGATQFFSQEVVFHRSSHFSRYAMRVYVVRKWPLRGRSRFVCWNVTRVSLWFLCNVYFVQSTPRTRPRDLADLKVRIIAAVKNIDAPTLTRVWQEIDVYISNISSCQKVNVYLSSLMVKVRLDLYM